VIPGVPTSRGAEHSSKGKTDQSNKNLPTAKDSDMHPLHAIYSKRCIEPIKKRLEVNDLRMISFHPDVRVRVVSSAEVERFDPDHHSLFNVNSPTDLEAAESLAAKERENINDYS
jgi:molybdopterin-guanine dinucleotide biosynthesis protein A